MANETDELPIVLVFPAPQRRHAGDAVSVLDDEKVLHRFSLRSAVPLPRGADTYSGPSLFFHRRVGVEIAQYREVSRAFGDSERVAVADSSIVLLAWWESHPRAPFSGGMNSSNAWAFSRALNLLVAGPANQLRRPCHANT